eukprot:Selendium_serpulae@DN4732_c0_g1_i1.p1
MMKCLTLKHHTRPVTCVTFNRDGDILFSTGKDGQCFASNSETGHRLGMYKLSASGATESTQAALNHCDVTFDSKKLVVASTGFSATVFDVMTGEELNKLDFSGVCRYVEFNKWPNKQDKFLAVIDQFGLSGREPQRVEVLKYIDGEYKSICRLSDWEDKCLEAHWGLFDKTIITGHSNGYIMEWDAETGTKLRQVKEDSHKHDIKCMAFTEQRDLMLTCAAGNDRSAILWDTVNFKVLNRYTSDRALNACDISPLWNSEDENLRRAHIIMGGGQEARDVAQSGQEGKFETIFYNMIHGTEQLGKVRGHFGPINSLAFMPDGKGFATGSEEGTIKITKFDSEYWDKLE